MEKKQKGFKLSEVRTNVCVFKVHLSTFKLASFNSLFGVTFSSVMNLVIESAKPLRSQTVPLRALARIKTTHFLKYLAVISSCAKYTQKSLRGWDIWCSVPVIATLQTAQHGKRSFSCLLGGIGISAEENIYIENNRVFPILYQISWISRIRWIQQESVKHASPTHSSLSWCNGYDSWLRISRL